MVNDSGVRHSAVDATFMVRYSRAQRCHFRDRVRWRDRQTDRQTNREQEREKD